MALDQRKRQRKVERKKAKQKARQQRQAEQRRREWDRVATGNIVHCKMSADLWEQGIGSVLISRAINSSEVALSVFLVDVWCLGVKDAFHRVLSRGEYEFEFLKDYDHRYESIDLPPTDARALVEGSVEFAQQFGLSPHSDYRQASRIFGDIDPEEYDRDFEFGHNGRPFFVQGPYDDPARCRVIEAKLREHG